MFAGKPAGGAEMKDQETIQFNIDGRAFTIEDPRQTAADLLRLAGLDPAGYDLAEIRGGSAHPHRFADDHVLNVKNGDRFVSIRERAEVA